jgi:phage-related protein (TIGR01555 family)
MQFKWPWSKPEAAPVAPIAAAPVKPERKNSVYHMLTPYAVDDLDLQAKVQEIQKKLMPRTIKSVGTDSVAMDSITRLEPAYAMDGFQSVYQTMNNTSPLLVSWYASQGFIGWNMCAILAQHWLVDKSCTIPAQDALRKGYEYCLNNGEELSPETIDKIRELNKKKYKLDREMEEYIRMSRVFGIRIAVFIVNTDDPLYYEKPFNIDAVKPGSYVGIQQVDPYWTAPILDMSAVSSPINMDFYEPTYWMVTGLKIHKSHICALIPKPVADTLKPTYFYGGIPLTQQIYERVYAAERCANESPQLLLTKRATVLNMDLSQAVANPEEVTQRLQAWAAYRDNQGVKLLGLDDKLEQLDTSLTDLDDVIMNQYGLVAAIADVPITRLMGTSPDGGGIGDKGEFESGTYRELLVGMQNTDLEPLITRHNLLMAKSELPEIDGAMLAVKWNPLDAPTAKEQADINKTKADTAAVYVNAGITDGQAERDRLSADPESGYSGIDLAEPVLPEEPEDDTAQ